MFAHSLVPFSSSFHRYLLAWLVTAYPPDCLPARPGPCPPHALPKHAHFWHTQRDHTPPRRHWELTGAPNHAPASSARSGRLPFWDPVLTPHPRFLSSVLSILHHRHCCVFFLPRRLSFSFVLVTLFFLSSLSGFPSLFPGSFPFFYSSFSNGSSFPKPCTGHRRLCRLLFFSASTLSQRARARHSFVRNRLDRLTFITHSISTLFFTLLNAFHCHLDLFPLPPPPC
jgi:hypothetical protein